MHAHTQYGDYTLGGAAHPHILSNLVDAAPNQTPWPTAIIVFLQTRLKLHSCQLNSTKSYRTRLNETFAACRKKTVPHWRSGLTWQ